MKKNKIFISLNDYEIPNAPLSYGVHLAKNLERPAYMYGVEKVPLQPEPVAITGLGIPTPMITDIEQVRKVAEKQLKELHYEATKIYDDVTYRVDIGFPESLLIEKTEETNPYMVVLEGNNKLTTVHEWFGTYETRLAENIEAPVLVLPSDHYWQPINRIMYVMDMEDHKINNMRFLTSLAKELKANIAVVLLSSERNEREMEKYNSIVNIMRNMLGYENVNFHQFFTENKADTIDRLIDNVDADWLAFEHESCSFIERMLDTYNTKRLILQSEIPVLVF